jgi:hypothetical protein
MIEPLKHYLDVFNFLSPLKWTSAMRQGFQSLSDYGTHRIALDHTFLTGFNWFNWFNWFPGSGLGTEIQRLCLASGQKHEAEPQGMRSQARAWERANTYALR